MKCLKLIRIITLKSLKHNVRFFGKHLGSKQNRAADNLSRLKVQLFKNEAAGKIDKWPAPLPDKLWPASKLWEPPDL